MLAHNEKRIDEIKARYFEKRDTIKTFHEVLQETKETFETRQRYKDNSLAYPTYGRGLIPVRDMNTFMIQPNLAGSPEQRRKEEANDGNSPQANIQARQRRKIRSPKRLRFENDFEMFMDEKYVKKPVSTIPADEAEMMERPPMDVVTKFKDSMNTIVSKNEERLSYQKQKRDSSLNNRNLTAIECDAQKLIAEERVVNLEKAFVENMRRVFVMSKSKEDNVGTEVIKEVFFDNLCNDAYFEPLLETKDVRESVDGVRETLDQLLFRVDKELTRAKITWEEFLETFTKRGKLRANEHIIFGPPLKTREEVLAETQRN